MQSSQKFNQKFHYRVHFWFMSHHKEVRFSMPMNVAWLHISVLSFPSTTGHCLVQSEEHPVVFYASKWSMRAQFCSVLVLQLCRKLQFCEKLFGKSHPVVLSLGAGVVLHKDRRSMSYQVWSQTCHLTKSTATQVTWARVFWQHQRPVMSHHSVHPGQCG